MSRLDNPSKNRIVVNTDNSKVCSSYSQEQKEKKRIISNLEAFSCQFCPREFQYMKSQILHGKFNPKLDSESWVDHYNRIKPSFIQMEF